MIDREDYVVAEPDALETPAMLLFRDLMDENIRRVCEMVGGGDNLMPHVKTHKAEAVTRRQLEAGVAGFKCATLQELAMVLEAGARRAVLAYPQVQERKVERLCDLAAAHPDAWVATIVSTPSHVDVLASVASRRNQSLRAMLDLDAGLRRTGIGFGPPAEELYRSIGGRPSLEPSGLHLYDGHDTFSDVVRRETAARQHIEQLLELQQRIESAGLPVPCILAGGSFSFGYYARTEGMYGSPGTFVYWDAGYTDAMPDAPFRCAALILTQVVDRYPGAGLITTDLGSKAVSSDLPVGERARLLGHPRAELRHQDEEHGVFRIPDDLPRVGEYLLAAPGHICPTTIRYPGIHVIDASGAVVDYYSHTARDRL